MIGQSRLELFISLVRRLHIQLGHSLMAAAESFLGVLVGSGAF